MNFDKLRKMNELLKWRQKVGIAALTVALNAIPAAATDAEIIAQEALEQKKLRKSGLLYESA